MKKPDRHDVALIASCALLDCILALNRFAYSPQYQNWAWQNIVVNEHCQLTTDTGTGGPRVYQCDDGYRVEGELKTMPDE